ncbi:MAG: EamA family transporter [Syntrophaceae bacterium]|nr:EamA family transporter [Syntrophaceae bacterium]
MNDWRIFSICCIVSWGLWGLFTKFSMNRLNWGTSFFIISLTCLLFSLAFIKWSSLALNSAIIYPVLAGLACALGFLCFYKASELQEMSVVLPVTSLYVVAGCVLSILFLNEALTVRKCVGILLPLVSIYLLSTK